MIKHVWFDFSETIASIQKEAHNNLRYMSYAEVVGRPVDIELIKEYENLYTQFEHSNAAVFKSLGMPGSYWSKRVNTVDPKKLYRLMDENIPSLLEKIKSHVPMSIFSNIQLDTVLPALGVPLALFNYVLSASSLKEPKPALEGFYKMVELSQLPADQILYIGDHVGKDILPAKKVGLKTGLMWTESSEADYCFKKFEDILNVFL